MQIELQLGVKVETGDNESGGALRSEVLHSRNRCRVCLEWSETKKRHFRKGSGRTRLLGELLLLERDRVRDQRECSRALVGQRQ